MTASAPAHFKNARHHFNPAAIPFWLACFCMPIILLVVISIWNGVYPFGAESFLTEDLKYQYIDFFTWYRGVLLGQNSIFYSFAQALGSNTWGLFSYYLASPFNLLIVLFDENHLVLFVYVITALKLGCIQLTCAWFLSRRFRIARSWVFTLSLCFAWCSWTATQLRNPMWLDALVLLPLMAYTAWKLIRDGRMLPLVLATVASVIVCWYTAYISILFTCLYVLFELACYVLDEKNAVTARWVIGRALRFAGAIALGMLLSAWTFVPTVLAMMGGSSVQDLGHFVRCYPLDLIKGILPGGYTLNRSPQFFTGTLVTLLAFAFLLCSRINSKLRLIALGLLAFLVAGSVFSALEYVWCGFRVPNGFYSRTAFLASFLAIWMAARYLQSRNEMPSERRRLSPAIRTAACGTILVLTAGELLVNAHLSWQSLYAGYPQEQHDTYVSEARSQLAELKAIDSSPFYRMDKAYTRASAAALNEGIAIGFDQLSSYSSANAPKAIKLLNGLGYSSEGEFSTRYTQPLLATDSLFGVRYAAAAGDFTGYEPLDAPTASYGSAWFRNQYALSLGFAANSHVADSDYPTGDNPFERQNTLFSTILGRDIALYRKLDASLVEDGSAQKRWEVEIPAGCLGYSYVVKGKGAGGNTIVNWSVDGSAPAAEGWRFDHTLRQIAPAQPDATTHAVTIASSDGIAPLLEGSDCVFYALDLKMFESIFDELASRQAIVTTMVDGQVEMTFHAEQTTTLLLSIPYDKGWSVQVNGESVDMRPAFDGGLSAIELPEGTDTISMTYRSPGFITGCIISGITLAALGISHAVKQRRAVNRNSPQQR